MRYYSSVAQETTLFAPMTSTQNTAQVSAIVGYPLSFPFTIAVDYDTALEELMDVISYTGDTFTVSRGVDNTSAVEHAAGAKVRHVASGRDFFDTQTHVAATTDVHGVDGDLVGTDSSQTLTNKNLADASNTFPNKFVTKTGNETLTNKNLTSGTNTFPSTLLTTSDTSVVKTTAAQTLTNKNLSDSSNTFPASFITASSSQTLTNKNLSSGTNTFPNTLVTLSGNQTLTNKTIDYNLNTIKNLPVGAAQSNVLLSSPRETVVRAGSAPAALINIDVATSSDWHYTVDATTDFAVNIRWNSTTSLGSRLNSGESRVVVLQFENDATAYKPTSFSIDGTELTGIKWLNGVNPTAAEISSTNVVTLFIEATGISGTYHVLGSFSVFKV